MENFCMMPWFAQFGKNMPCCHLQKNFNIERVKSDLLQDRRSSDCKSCWHQEDLGQKSCRQIYNDIAEQYAPLGFLKKLAEEGKSKPIIFQVQKSNTCNGACLMCNETSSSKWASLKSNKQKKLDDDSFDDYVDYKTAKKINVLGGEPFLDNSIEIVIEKLSKFNNDKCEVSVTTNGSIFPNKKLFALMKKHDVKISVSIDGVGQMFEYQRWPLQWNEVEKNVLEFQKNFAVGVSYCLTNINVFEHQTTVKFFNNHKLPYAIHRVNYPIFFSPDFLPMQIKQQSVDDNLCSWRDFDSKDYTKQFQTTINQIKLQDKIKNISMKDYLPKIYKLFENYF